jgi:quercetin dioxygenase-like cupin family protein
MRYTLLLATALLPIGLASARPSAAQGRARQAVVATPSTLTWGPAPATLPTGASLAVLDGDPTKAGPYTMRLRIPAGYRVLPHFHPADEHVTVIQGTFLVGMGDKFDAAQLEQLPTGSFGMIPAGMHHFAQAQGEVILQLHGIGPWSLTYVNPADAPRPSTKK